MYNEVNTAIKKCILFSLVFSSALFLSNALAESYYGIINAKTTTGRDKSYSIAISYETKADGSIQGKYNPQSAGPCGGERPILGVMRDGMLEFITDVHGLKGCGANRFKGKKDGDNWVGQINFGGEQKDITFVKSK
jgi:hypothetical protein